MSRKQVLVPGEKLTYGLEGTEFNTTPEPKEWQNYKKIAIPSRRPLIKKGIAEFSDGTKYQIQRTGQYVRINQLQQG